MKCSQECDSFHGSGHSPRAQHLETKNKSDSFLFLECFTKLFWMNFLRKMQITVRSDVVWRVDHQFKTMRGKCVLFVLIGSDMDSHCWIHNGFRGNVCQDMEGARHLQKCENEEEGRENCYIVSNFYWWYDNVQIMTHAIRTAVLCSSFTNVLSNLLYFGRCFLVTPNLIWLNVILNFLFLIPSCASAW